MRPSLHARWLPICVTSFGPRGEAVADHAQFIELMHERLLAVDVFVVLQRREHHRRVVKVGRIDDHGVELIRRGWRRLRGNRLSVHALGNSFAILSSSPPVHVAEAGQLDHRVILQPLALHRADAADADLEDAQLAVLVGLRARRPRRARRCRR